MRHTLLILSATVLSGIGLLFIFSTTSVRYEHDPYIFFKKQLIAFFFGISLMFLFSKMPFELIKKFSPLVFALFLALTILTLFLGGKVKRWIYLPGFSIQPVEFMKVSFVLLLSNILPKIKKIDFYTVAMFYILSAAVAFPIILQPDYGNFVLVFIITSFMLFVSGAKIFHILSITLPVIPFFVFLVISSPYRMKRILVFLDPWKDPTGDGFQLIQSILSYAAGGLTGVGIGEGMQKLFFLPASHTDFIISSIAEEAGLIGVIFVVLLFLLFGVIGFSISIDEKDKSKQLAVAGLTFLIVFQAFFNMLVSVGLLPTKGLPLPFISYGGSSLVACLSSVGIILSVIRDEDKSFFS